MALGQICIITSTGMICESESYEHHGHLPPGTPPALPPGLCKKSGDKVPAGLENRVVKLIQLAKSDGFVEGQPFVIMTKP